MFHWGLRPVLWPVDHAGYGHITCRSGGGVALDRTCTLFSHCIHSLSLSLLYKHFYKDTSTRSNVNSFIIHHTTVYLSGSRHLVEVADPLSLKATLGNTHKPQPSIIYHRINNNHHRQLGALWRGAQSAEFLCVFFPFHQQTDH